MHPADVQHSKVLIIGSGPAGYTAGVYAARAALEPRLIEGPQPGGQLTITTDVENWPGDDSVLGPDLMARMGQQVRKAGVDVVSDLIVAVDLTTTPFLAIGDGGAHYTADTIVVATGASARWLGLESETEYRGRGVSACATCDGFFYRGRVCAVVGGGNTAVEEALYLTNFAEKVYLIHRRDTLRADRTNQARLHANPKIEMIWNAEVAEVLGDASGVTGVALRDTRDGTASEMAVHGLFVAIGHDPATSLFKGQLRMDDEGYILVTHGAPLSDALFDRLIAARHFLSGMFIVRQVEFGLFDLLLHLGTMGSDPMEVIEAVRDEVAVVRPPAWHRFPHAFTHIFASGYAAGYYSYLWAEVLAADGFQRFAEAGLIDRSVAARFCTEVLSRGASRPAADSFRAFRGRDADPQAMLVRHGLASDAR